jgi:Domain of unknown function (DUF1707)
MPGWTVGLGSPGSEVFNVDSSDSGYTLSSRESGPGLRVSDAERDVVATELSEHFQVGRLDKAEFDERLTLALRARTRGDLAGLLADLPAQRRPSPAPARPEVPRGPQPGSDYQLLPLLIPVIFATIIIFGLAAHGGPHGGPHDGAGAWPLLWLWWVIPIAAFRARRRAARGLSRDR